MCLAVPGRVLSVADGAEAALRTGRVDFGGVIKEVCLACTPDAGVDDYVLVHAGLAITVVDAAEAGRVIGYLREIEALQNVAGPGSAPA
jgi:hydrogenase expression/formation protein HypC